MTSHNIKKNKALFAQGSYNRWAMKEIDKYIAQNKDRSIIEVLEEFRYKMDRFACNARTGEANFMFSVAYDVVTDMLDKEISK